MRLSIYSFLTLWILCAVRTAPADIPAPDFTLQDQYGKLHRVAFPKARVSVFALADRAGSAQLEGWVSPLYQRYRDTVEIHGIAKLAGVPLPMRGMLRAIFRRNLDYPVMMDWTGAVSTHYNYQARMANVLVLNAAGRIEYRFNGPASPEELKLCFEQIDELLTMSAPRAD
jgi:hypothetical protein